MEATQPGLAELEAAKAGRVWASVRAEEAEPPPPAAPPAVFSGDLFESLVAEISARDKAPRAPKEVPRADTAVNSKKENKKAKASKKVVEEEEEEAV